MLVLTQAEGRPALRAMTPTVVHYEIPASAGVYEKWCVDSFLRSADLTHTFTSMPAPRTISFVSSPHDEELVRAHSVDLLFTLEPLDTGALMA
jgi:hypothetical protein